jgi:DNA-binding TFAR19-related protein (PDSD5 family)
VQWLVTPVTSPSALSAHIGRLGAIAIAQPEIAEEIEQYVAALRSLPTPGKAQ